MSKKRIEEQVVTFTRRVTIETKKCPVCGTRFEGRTRKKYCSPTCRRSADYRQHADSRRLARMKRYQEQKEQPKR